MYPFQDHFPKEEIVMIIVAIVKAGLNIKFCKTLYLLSAVASIHIVALVQCFA